MKNEKCKMELVKNKKFPKSSYIAMRMSNLYIVKQKEAEQAGINTKNCYY